MSLVGTGITMAFGGLVALRNASVEVHPGTVHALIGPNGAGKTTLINCLSGFLHPATGTVVINDLDLTSTTAHDRVSKGVGRSFQTPRADPDASVFAAVLVGLYAQSPARFLRTIFRTPAHRRETARNKTAVLQLLNRFGLAELATAPVGQLPLWQLRLLEVARSMALAPQYLLLDEPAAGLDQEEQRVLRNAIRDLRDADVGLLLVEHDFEFVRSLADEITVLDRGEVLARGTAEEIERNPDVVDAYLGVADDQ